MLSYQIVDLLKKTCLRINNCVSLGGMFHNGLAWRPRLHHLERSDITKILFILSKQPAPILYQYPGKDVIHLVWTDGCCCFCFLPSEPIRLLRLTGKYIKLNIEVLKEYLSGDTCRKSDFLFSNQIYSAGKQNAEFSQKVNSFIKTLPPSVCLSLRSYIGDI